MVGTACGTALAVARVCGAAGASGAVSGFWWVSGALAAFGARTGVALGARGDAAVRIAGATLAAADSELEALARGVVVARRRGAAGLAASPALEPLAPVVVCVSGIGPVGRFPCSSLRVTMIFSWGVRFGDGRAQSLVSSFLVTNRGHGRR